MSWSAFLRYYRPAVFLAVLPVAFCVALAAMSYVSTGLQVLIWMCYLLTGVVRLVVEGGVPLARVRVFDETYYEPVYDKDAFGEPYIVGHQAVAGQVSADGATANAALDWACRASVVLFWGGLDVLLQGGFLVSSALAYRRAGRVAGSRHAHWARAGGYLVLPAAALVTLGGFYLSGTASRTPPVLDAGAKGDLVAAFAAGRTYHGTWEGYPQAGTLGLRIVSLSAVDRHNGREVEGVLYDAARPEVTRSFKGRIMFLKSAGEYPVILTPDGRFQQVPPAPDLSIYVGTERGAELFLKLGPNEDVVAAGDVPLIFRPVGTRPTGK